MSYRHGGDIYRTKVNIDFSVNINPLGMPDMAMEAAIKGVELSTTYPDWSQEALRTAVSEHFHIKSDSLIFGNGATDLIYRLMRVLEAPETVVMAPAFAEYKRAAEMAQSHVTEFMLSERDDFCLTERGLNDLLRCIDTMAAGSVLFLCNPNNPDGGMLKKEVTLTILEACERQGVWLVMDECFLPFISSERELSMMDKVSDGVYQHLIVIRAFTKIYGMPGLRLGYMVSENASLLEKVWESMTPWEINIPAEMAGIAALKDKKFIEDTRRLISQERAFMVRELRGLSFVERVYNPDSQANFILFKVKDGTADLKEELIKSCILIRSCSDYTGLSDSFYRVCVRLHGDNETLISELREIDK